MKTYAYIRVSTTDQSEDRQLDTMVELDIPKSRIFIDKQSGKDFNRPAWQDMIKELEPGDLLYIKSIDRLGRNYEDIQNWWRILTKEYNIDIAVIDMPILDTRNGKDLIGTFLFDTFLGLLGFVSQIERESIKKRQAEGIASAKNRGVKFGRPKKKPPKNFAQVVKNWECGKINFDEALKQTGLKQATFYNRLREYRSEK